MDTKGTDEKPATSAAPAQPAPKPRTGEPEPEQPVPSVPLSGLGDNSLEGSGVAFSGLFVGAPESKEKAKEEVDMGGESRDPGNEHYPSDEVPVDDKPSESAPSASDHPAAPSPTTTTLLATHLATSSPTTAPPMAEGLGFTGMPYPTYGVNPVATAPPMATAVSEPVASSSTYTGIHERAPLLYAESYRRPQAGVCPTYIPGYAAPEPSYAMPAPGFACLSGLRGPRSCGGRSTGSARSANRSLTRSEIEEALCSASGELVADMTQEIRNTLKPLLPPEGSAMTIGASPHRVQANHLVAGLTHTRGGVRSRPMPTPAAVPRSPIVPRTAQPPSSHVEHSRQAQLDHLRLTALRAMVDVEPYGSSDLGGDPSDDKPPSLTSVSPSDDDDPEVPKKPSGRKKMKKRKSKRNQGCRSEEAKAFATSEIVVNSPEFTGKDLSEFAESFGRSLRMTSQTHATGWVKCDLLLQCCKTNYLEKQVKQIVTQSAMFAEVFVALERQYPSYETHLSNRTEIQKLAMLRNNTKAARMRISKLLADLDHWVGLLTPGLYGSDEMGFWLVTKIPRGVWDECRATAERKSSTLTYEDLSVLLLELALEKESDQHLNAYGPGCGNSRNHGCGHQRPRPGQAITPRMLVICAMCKTSSRVMPETSRAASCMPRTATSMRFEV